MKKYEEMTRKELLRLAKLHGVKGRSRMNKERLIKEIKNKKRSIEKMKEYEERLKNKKISKYHNKDFVQALPKEPGILFVHWEIKKKDNLVLRIVQGKKKILDLPVMSNKGDGYLKVEEGKKLNAIIGEVRNGRFRKVVESPPVLVPVSKPSEDKTVKWVKVGKPGKVSVRQKKIAKEDANLLEKKKKATERAAKSIKYINVTKER